MRITLIGPVYPYRGGIAHFTNSLCQELAAAGHQVQAISFKRQYPSWLYPGQTDQDPSAVHDQFPALYTLDPLYPWTWAGAVRQAAAFQPDLAIVQWWTTFWAPAFFFLSAALKRRGISCVFCIHNVIPHENRLPDVWLSRGVLSRGQGFITLSPQESGRLRKLIPAARVYSARLPTPKVQPAVTNREEARKALGIAEDRRVILFFGIVRPYKGLRVLIDALGLLKEQHCRPLLIVAGEFWEDEQQYRAQIDRLGLQDQVIIENRYLPNEDLPRYYRAADGFVAPHTQGTQSGAIKMAMSYHLPLLVSDQISSDLPLDSYPIFLHQAGSSVDLARSIQAFFNEKILPAARQDNDEWRDLVVLVEEIAADLAKQQKLRD